MISNSISERVAQEYENLRRQREDFEQDYKTKLYNALPVVEQIDKEISLLAVRWAYKVVTDGITPEQALENMEKTRDELNAKRAEIIRSAGFMPFEPFPFKCERCSDTGEIDGEKCQCYNEYLRKAMTESAKEISHFACDIEEDTFENFKFEYYDSCIIPAIGISPVENMKRIYSYCTKYCDTFGEKSPNLFLTGASGVGKTYLSNCIANQLLAKGHTVVYQSAASMFRFLEDYKFDRVDRDENNEYYKSIYDCELLIIDDLGTEFPTSYTNSVFFDLVNTRLLNNKKTVISTNTTVKDIEKKYTERVSSRIIGEFRILTLIGSDIRKKKMELNNGGKR